MTEAIDTALELLDGYGPEFHRLSNHGPMAAEALLALGRDDAVVGWVERYRQRLQPHPAPTQPIDGAHWGSALGEFARVADWKALFDVEIAELGWRATVTRWVPRLVPGLASAGFHGSIRTAHAVRSLSGGETPLRLAELAEGFAFWAARYQTMPGAPSSPGTSTPARALQDVPRLPPDRRVAGLISDELASLDGFTPFLPVVDLIDVTDPARALSGITATFARVYLANADTAAFSFVHSLTGPSALRMLLPFVDEQTSREAVRFAWQAAAGLYAAAGNVTEAPFEGISIDVDELIDRAVSTRDEHAIKFTEACLRENGIQPDPVFAAAAADLSGRMRAHAS